MQSASFRGTAATSSIQFLSRCCWWCRCWCCWPVSTIKFPLNERVFSLTNISDRTTNRRLQTASDGDAAHETNIYQPGILIPDQSPQLHSLYNAISSRNFQISHSFQCIYAHIYIYIRIGRMLMMEPQLSRVAFAFQNHRQRNRWHIYWCVSDEWIELGFNRLRPYFQHRVPVGKRRAAIHSKRNCQRQDEDGSDVPEARARGSN